MPHSTARALAATILAAAAITAMPGPAQATAPARTGVGVGASNLAAAAATANNMYPTLSGVPATLAVGGTIDLTLNLRWDSLYPIDLTAIGIAMGSSVPDAPPTQGISVLWKDPVTGAWRGSDRIAAATGRWAIVEPQGAVIVSAGDTLTVHLRITMGAKAVAGTEHINAGLIEFTDADGGDLLQGHVTAHIVQETFKFGNAGEGSGSQPTPIASAAPAPTAMSAVGTLSSPAGSGAAGGLTRPAGSAGTRTGPTGPPGTTSGPGPVPPSRTLPPDTITEANTVFHGANGLTVFGAAAVLLSFLVGSALVIVRSRRPALPAAEPSHAGSATEPSHSDDED